MKEDNELLTKKELMEFLSICNSTVKNYVDKGYLKPLGMDRRVWFLKSDVMKALHRGYK